MVYPIVKFGDPVLERLTEPIAEFDTPELHKLIEDMFESMYAARGVGLAAPQIGISKRIAVIDVSSGERPEDRLVCINPEIVKVEGKQVGEEGCLSIPGFREEVKRGKRVTMRARDARGEFWEKTGEDLLARAFQHETDHLLGKLYISHISALKRDLIRRKIRKLERAGEWA
jgi:peptide deformylase